MSFFFIGNIVVLYDFTINVLLKAVLFKITSFQAISVKKLASKSIYHIGKFSEKRVQFTSTNNCLKNTKSFVTPYINARNNTTIVVNRNGK